MPLASIITLESILHFLRFYITALRFLRATLSV
jgi:hypothetical protein